MVSSPEGIVLASRSPRRSDLLKSIGVRFRVIIPQVDEDEYLCQDPIEAVRCLAVAKARSVARLVPGSIVIGADTIVLLKGAVLGKPQDGQHAKQMLRALSGNRHEVISGVAVVPADEPDAALVAHEVTVVHFRSLSEREIAAYVASGEPADKAGAYGIQGLASLFVSRIEGCYFNVVGLPLARLGLMLAECGVNLLS